MSAGTQQPKIRRQRRIIERPRLTKLLDECEARIILLLAPAGYGKTTLARQWAKTLNKTVWVTCTPAHRDVVSLAEDIAKRLDELGGHSTKFVREYFTVQSNAHRAAERLARSLSEEALKLGVQWIVIDDYHELADSAEAEYLIEVLQSEAVGSRFLISTRMRPGWARSRLVVYGTISEIDRQTLAMTDVESRELLGRDESMAQFARQAQGWPAVLALAASAGDVTPPTTILPSALHAFLAQELFQAAVPSLRHQLVRLALLPKFTLATAQTYLGVEPGQLLTQARDLGFVSGDDDLDIHPLLREFLLERLSEYEDAEDHVRKAVDHCLTAGLFDGALRLVTLFAYDDLVEPVLCEAFKPLIRAGRMGTLSDFASDLKIRPAFPPPSVDVIEAEVALRDGQIELAGDLARRAAAHLSATHPLRSRTSAILGHSCLLSGSFGIAQTAFADAKATAQDDRDAAEAIHGFAVAQIMGEEDAAEAVAALNDKRYDSPIDLVRAATTALIHRRYTDGIAGSLAISEGEHALEQVDDPRARSSFTYLVAYTLAQRAEYRDAQAWVCRLMEDVNGYDLEFARPHATWLDAHVRLGLRRFGETERLLQNLEDMIANDQDSAHSVNARLLRSRLLLQTGKTTDACELVAQQPIERSDPAWRAEYLATRALALACAGDRAGAVRAEASATALSNIVEVRVLKACVSAVLDAQKGRLGSGSQLLKIAKRLGAWDPVVCALRASRDLSDGLASDPATRSAVAWLYAISNDLGLARRAGFRTRATRSPDALLSPRESEVLGLIARGMRNRDIAQALFISQSTAKAHVRHVLEKLGVRSRSEAVARHEMFNGASRPTPGPTPPAQ